jgi:hypothetical protein
VTAHMPGMYFTGGTWRALAACHHLTCPCQAAKEERMCAFKFESTSGMWACPHYSSQCMRGLLKTDALLGLERPGCSLSSSCGLRYGLEPVPELSSHDG